MKMLVELEWDDENGEYWLNEDNLKALLFGKTCVKPDAIRVNIIEANTDRGDDEDCRHCDGEGYKCTLELSRIGHDCPQPACFKDGKHCIHDKPCPACNAKSIIEETDHGKD